MRDGLECLIPGEDQIPGLAGKNQHNRRQLRSDLLRQHGAQAQQDDRQKGENRHALQDIEEGHEDVLNTVIAGRGTPIPQRKE